MAPASTSSGRPSTACRTMSNSAWSSRIDESRIEVDRVPAERVGELGQSGRRGRRRALSGADRLGHRGASPSTREQMPLEYGTASYGDIWKPKMDGRRPCAAIPASSASACGWRPKAACRRRCCDAFDVRGEQVAIYDVILAEAIARKGQHRPVLDQRERSAGRLPRQWLRRSARPGIRPPPRSPRKGCRSASSRRRKARWPGWKALSIPSGAANLDQAYAFINWFLTPEAGAMYTNATSINSTAVGADRADLGRRQGLLRGRLSGRCAGQAVVVADPGKLVSSTKRNEYQDRFLSA